jgi:hypothetical protein
MFDWREYVRLGKALHQAAAGAATEKALSQERSAISRAYYGAYHVAWLYLKNADKKDPPRDHSIWNLFLVRGRTEPERDVGVEGHRLMGWRVEADYRDPMKIRSALSVQAEDALESAEMICKLLGNPL